MKKQELLDKLNEILEKLADGSEGLDEGKLGTAKRSFDESRTALRKLTDDIKYS